MKLYDFINHLEIKEISNNIKNKKEFNFERNVKEYSLMIESNKASTDWGNGTEKGDYIISIRFSTKTSGSGRPLSGSKLKELENEKNLTDYLDKYLKDNKIENYKTVNEGQINLFSL